MPANAVTIEIEAKMRIGDAARLEARLESLQAVCRGAVVQRNTYYDTPASALREADRGLRLRIEQSADGSDRRAVITHKGPRAPGPVKRRSETELTVPDAEQATRLLRALGYVPVLMFEKRRRTWRLDDCLVEIDTVPHLGDFVEIEGPSEETVLAVRRRLELSDAPLITTSYVGLLHAHLDTHDLQTREVTF